MLFHCVVRLGLAQLGSAQFEIPLQFSITLKWVALFTCCYSCAASTAVTPEKRFHSALLHQALTGIRSSAIKERTDFLNRQLKIHFWVVKKRWAHLCSILRWLGWFESSGSVVSRVANSVTQVVILSSQSVISRVYTSHCVNGTVRLEPQPRWYWKKYQVPGTVPSEKKTKTTEPYRTEPNRAVPCSGNAPLHRQSLSEVKIGRCSPAFVGCPWSLGPQKTLHHSLAWFCHWHY